jgi:hypothetical protein
VSGFLLDTNVISELTKPGPEPRVVSWLASVSEDLLHPSVLTLGEIRKGIAALAPSRRRVLLEAWLEGELRARFASRVLPIDEAVADRWGQIAGMAAAAGAPVPVIDGLLAATALHYNLTLVTRNPADLAQTGASLFSPWSD